MPRPKPSIDVADAELAPRSPGLAPEGPAVERDDARVGRVSRAPGAKKLGDDDIAAVPPGKRAVPAHDRFANEELLCVVDLRLRPFAARRTRRGGQRSRVPAGPTA